jgi:uncharacterized damage-inducible protein DinB
VTRNGSNGTRAFRAQEDLMHTLSKWVDRRFGYQPPAGEYPAIVERLRGTPARVEDRVRYLNRVVLRARDGDGWTVQEHVGHLLDLEPLWGLRVVELLTGAAELSPADMSNRRTREADHNARAMAAIAAEFRVARDNLVARLDDTVADDVERTALHPRLKRPMRLIDLCFFVAEHDDHHLAIVSRLARRASR